MIFSGTLQITTKNIAGRARPHLGLGHGKFEPFRNDEAYYSFFSGHTMVAMVTSHAFARQIDHPIIKLGLYGIGGLGGLSRVYGEDHWLSDVVMGSLVGIMSVNSAAKWLQERKKTRKYAGLQLKVYPSIRGLRASFMW